MNPEDCIFPDCQIYGNWLGAACEHSCPFEAERKDDYEPPETGDAWTGGFAANH